MLQQGTNVRRNPAIRVGQGLELADCSSNMKELATSNCRGHRPLDGHEKVKIIEYCDPQFCCVVFQYRRVCSSILRAIIKKWNGPALLAQRLSEKVGDAAGSLIGR